MLATFVPGHLRATPWASAVATVPGGAETATALVTAALGPHTRADGSTVVPFRAALIDARSPSTPPPHAAARAGRPER
jgi:hypothetical protein